MWVFIFSGLIACTGKLVTSSCPVKLSPSSAVVRIGDPFSANCSSLSDQVEGMGWESSNGGISLTTGVSFLHLNIKSVTDWRLNPECFINLSENQCSQTLPVTVYKWPDMVSMSQPSEGPMIEGEKYQVQCDIVDVAPVRNLSVHWHKGNKIVYTETFDEFSAYPTNKTSFLNLTAHRDDHGSDIWCEAKLNFWPPIPNLSSNQTMPRKVTVLYPPTFSNPADEKLELPAGGEIILNCSATGNPMPTYSWHFPHPVPLANKDLNTNQPILTPSFQFPGTYNCTASNSQGTKTKYFTVIAATGDRTTFTALIGGFVSLAVLLFVVGLFFVTPEGTFSCSKGSYLRGRPTSSGPV